MTYKIPRVPSLWVHRAWKRGFIKQDSWISPICSTKICWTSPNHPREFQNKTRWSVWGLSALCCYETISGCIYYAGLNIGKISFLSISREIVYIYREREGWIFDHLVHWGSITKDEVNCTFNVARPEEMPTNCIK